MHCLVALSTSTNTQPPRFHRHLNQIHICSCQPLQILSISLQGRNHSHHILHIFFPHCLDASVYQTHQGHVTSHHHLTARCNQLPPLSPHQHHPTCSTMSHLFQYYHLTTTTPLLQAPQAQQSTAISQKHHQISQNHHSTCPRVLSTLPVSSQRIQPRTRETIPHNHPPSSRSISTHTFTSTSHHSYKQTTTTRHLQHTTDHFIHTIHTISNHRVSNESAACISQQRHTATPTANSMDTSHTDPRLDPAAAAHPSQHASP